MNTETVVGPDKECLLEFSQGFYRNPDVEIATRALKHVLSTSRLEQQPDLFQSFLIVADRVQEFKDAIELMLSNLVSVRKLAGCPILVYLGATWRGED